MNSGNNIKINQAAKKPASQGLSGEHRSNDETDGTGGNDVAREAENFEVARLEKAPSNISSDVISLIPEEVAKKYKIAAFEKNEDVVKVAMVDSHDINALNALRFVAEKEKMEIEAYLVSEKVFNEITSFYSGPSEVIKKAVKLTNSFWSKLPKPFFAIAPMANVTDEAFRRMFVECGKPDVFWTEFAICVRSRRRC